MSTIKSLPARAAAVLAAFALAAATLAGALLPAGAAHATTVEIIDHGHLDVFRTVASSPTEIQLKLEKPDQTLTDAENVAIYVKDEAYTEGTKSVPGIRKPTYSLTQTQDNYNIPWPGWSNMGVEAKGFNRVDFVMDSVTGPGDLYIYQQRGLGELKFTPMVEAQKATGDKSLRTGDVLVDNPPSHTHFYWSFTEKGVYQITAHAKAYNSAGHTVESARHTVTFYIGVDPRNAAASESENKQEATAGSGKSEKGKGGESAEKKQNVHNDGNKKKESAAPDKNGKAHLNKKARTTTINPAPVPAAVAAGEKCLPTKVEYRFTAEEVRRQGLIAGDGQALSLLPLIKDDRKAPARWVSPSSLTFGISQAGLAKLPAEVRNSFGMPEAGYVIGSTQVPGIPWVGANTQNPSVEQQVAGNVTWRLDSVQGPGKLAVFESGNFGKVIGNVWFSKPGDTHQLGLNTHVHPNWVFSKAGTYRVTISQSARLRNGQTVSGSAVLTFIAGGSGNANEGHFDFGAEIRQAGAAGVTGKQVRKNPDGSYTVTEVVGRTSSGKPCSLDRLARTGASTFLIPLLVLACGLTLAGVGSVALRSQLRV